ncbi:MAG: polysaccharide biosynthesis tyrosine autokinase, partial [Candidatus Hydrogenedentes bacterium]|nr:polysaccharide biosynthesis tyrosine autokinase [Candidatus Hydrogenedentota bacterium]
KSVKQLVVAVDVAKGQLEEKKKEVTAKSIAQLKEMRLSQFQGIDAQHTELSNQIAKNSEQLKTLGALLSRLEQETVARDQAEHGIEQLNIRLMDLRLLKESEEPLVLHRRAMLPRIPSIPKYTIMIPAGVFLGLVFGLGLALLLEFLDTSIKAPSDVSRRVDLPSLGMVPHLDDVEEDIEDLRLAFLTNPNTIISESFRQIRTTLMFSGPAEQRKSILITSPMPEDGRTSVSLNLAHAIVSSGKRVLVVEANFRQPMFRKLFPMCPEDGLSNTLVGQADWRKLVYEVEPNFYVMASGPIPPNPAELLGSEQMRQRVAEFCEEYDQVIFNGSPCLVVSDAAVLSTVVDGVILVVRAGINTYGIVQRSRDILTRLGTHIFGVVLNGVRVTTGGYLRKSYETF